MVSPANREEECAGKSTGTPSVYSGKYYVSDSSAESVDSRTSNEAEEPSASGYIATESAKIRSSRSGTVVAQRTVNSAHKLTV